MDKDGGHRDADSVQTQVGHAPDNASSAEEKGEEKGTEAISGLIMRGPETGRENCLRPLFRPFPAPCDRIASTRI
jgi:hypothetical protein